MVPMGGARKTSSRQALSLKYLGFCLLPKQGCIPSTAPWLHAHQPRLPEVKGLHCLHPPCLPSPPPLASLRLPEEGMTRFLLLVLNPL